MIFVSYNAASNEPVPGAQGPNEVGAFMNIAPEERSYRRLERLPDDVLSAHRYKSAFSHTPFRTPRLDLSGPYTQAHNDL